MRSGAVLTYFGTGLDKQNFLRKTVNIFLTIIKIKIESMKRYMFVIFGKKKIQYLSRAKLR